VPPPPHFSSVGGTEGHRAEATENVQRQITCILDEHIIIIVFVTRKVP